MTDGFKIGAKVACEVFRGSYQRYYENPETIIRETKTCWVTESGEKFYKTDHYKYGTRNERWYSQIYILWTEELEKEKQERLLRKNLEKEIFEALNKHQFSIKQLQNIKSFLKERE